MTTQKSIKAIKEITELAALMILH